MQVEFVSIFRLVISMGESASKIGVYALGEGGGVIAGTFGEFLEGNIKTYRIKIISLTNK